MVTHPSILLIEDSPGECELFRLALTQTSLDVVLYTEHDADAALHFLEDRVHHSLWSLQARSFNILRGRPGSVFQCARYFTRPTLGAPGRAISEGAHSDRAPSASKETDQRLPSLILLDLKLGRRNGCDFLIRVRADARLAAIPVVVFTTSDDQTDLAIAMPTGRTAMS